jgi:hypothetical protein
MTTSSKTLVPAICSVRRLVKLDNSEGILPDRPVFSGNFVVESNRDWGAVRVATKKKTERKKSTLRDSLPKLNSVSSRSIPSSEGMLDPKDVEPDVDDRMLLEHSLTIYMKTTFSIHFCGLTEVQKRQIAKKTNFSGNGTGQELISACTKYRSGVSRLELVDGVEQ